MEVELPSDMLAPGRAVFSELLALNRREADAFNEIVNDYLASMQTNRELQVRLLPHPGSACIARPVLSLAQVDKRQAR